MLPIEIVAQKIHTEECSHIPGRRCPRRSLANGYAPYCQLVKRAPQIFVGHVHDRFTRRQLHFNKWDGAEWQKVDIHTRKIARKPHPPAVFEIQRKPTILVDTLVA